MYIGEGDPVGERIYDHIRLKHFWKRGVFFTAEGDRLNKAHIQYLESCLVTLAMDAKRVKLDNQVQPALPALSEEDRAFADNFLYDIRLTLPLLGFWQFRAEADEDADPGPGPDLPRTAGRNAELNSQLPRGFEFELSWREVNAQLRIVEEGFPSSREVRSTGLTSNAWSWMPPATPPIDATWWPLACLPKSGASSHLHKTSFSPLVPPPRRLSVASTATRIGGRAPTARASETFSADNGRSTSSQMLTCRILEPDLREGHRPFG